MHLDLPILALLLWVFVTFLQVHVDARYSRVKYDPDYQRYNYRHRHGKKTRRSSKPNIIMLLTDDQDRELGSMNFMPKTLRILRDGGADFVNSFVTTPMCCPSRSSILTGMYTHNHNVYTNNQNCSSLQWQQTHETRNFGTYLSNAGYRTGFFGKYLNEYNGTYIPPGWSEWVGLIRNSRFYNYTLNFNGKKIKHGDDYHADYLTDLIANDSITFLKQSKQYFPNRPVAMVLSVPAPHGPEDSAPQYQHLFENITTHRSPSWNYAPNPDKQWLLQYTGKMQSIHMTFTDMLQRKRLQTLQSVDDAVEKMCSELQKLGELDNTYFIYTSDHGYHLGQYGLVKGKSMPYEFDIRVPTYIKGPGVPRGVRIPNIMINIDLAPTILDIAGIPIPLHMDGRSVLRLFENVEEIANGVLKKKKAWRDTFLVERGKITHRQLMMREKQEAKQNNLPHTKEQRLEADCAKPEYQSPCKPYQQWECVRTGAYGRLRMQKCRARATPESTVTVVKSNDVVCVCPTPVVMEKKEKRKQRQFLKEHVNKPKNLKAKFLRHRRSVVRGVVRSKQQFRRLLRQKQASKILSKTPNSKQENSSLFGKDILLGDDGSTEVMHQCKILSNNSVICDKQLYHSLAAWRKQKERLDAMIREYRQMIGKLKGIRKHLKVQKPTNSFIIDSNTGPTTTSPSTTNTSTMASTSITSPVDISQTQTAHTNPPECDCDAILQERAQFSRMKTQRKRIHRLQKRDIHSSRRRGRLKDKDCNSPNMKCFTQDNQHWKTSPFWTSFAQKRRLGKGARKDPTCWLEGLECSLMDNDHWKVAPRWKMGPFCFCPNANNNTYWCVRTLNDTHNFLYCEFITGFISYYDMMVDPYQLRNAVHDLSYGVLFQLQETLNHLRNCKGRECNVRYRPKSTPARNDNYPKRGKRDVDINYDDDDGDELNNRVIKES